MTEIEVILGKVDELVSWASDIKEYALQQALSGKEWNMATSWSKAAPTVNTVNEAAVIAAVEEAGFDPYERSCSASPPCRSSSASPALMNSSTAYIEKPQGKPTLVPESDKRPAMNTAKNDFMEEKDYE
jgi:hypothetical protein